MLPGNSRDPRRRPAPAAAIVLTVAALVDANLVIAYLLARAAGLRTVEVPAVGVAAMLVAAVVTGALAVLLWRRYLAEARRSAA